MVWSTVSKAADRFRRIRSAKSPWLTALRIPDSNHWMAVSVGNNDNTVYSTIRSQLYGHITSTSTDNYMTLCDICVCLACSERKWSHHVTKGDWWAEPSEGIAYSVKSSHCVASRVRWDTTTGLYICILDTVPPIHVAWNHVGTDKLTTANGRTFTLSSASLNSLEQLDVKACRSLIEQSVTWLAVEPCWARSKGSAICSGKLISAYMIPW